MTNQSPLPDNLNYLVVGLGLTGYSVARFLLSKGYRCNVQDTRDIPPYLAALNRQFNDIKIHCQPLDNKLIDWADVLVVSPGVSIHQNEFRQARKLGKQIVGDIELFARLVQAPVVAITGSNGKSTVTKMVGEMLAAGGRTVAVGGNIGTPALDLLEVEADVYVLELSSYQLETTTSLRPEIAVLLNLSEDHLDRYADYAGYAQAKRRIFHNALQCISNADDGATRHDANDLCFSLQPDSKARYRVIEQNEVCLARGDDPWLAVSKLCIGGRHNWANSLAAMAVADHFRVSKKAIIAVMQRFKGIPHRSQWVAEVDGVEWINDSKATNIGAAKASIEGRERPVILIAGGQSKGADMTKIVETLRQKVKRVLLLGVDAEIMQMAWQEAVPVERVSTMREAVKRANIVADSGDCVLLAPACASFDMYEKFEARGEDFMQRVAEVTGVNSGD